MTWLEFKNAVKTLITVDGVRLNTVSFVDAEIRQAVIDLQSYVPEMRFPHETRYLPADLNTDGFASIGTLPDQAIPRDMYYVKDNDIPGGVDNVCVRSPIEIYDWGNRYDLVCGNIQLNGCRYKIAMSPQATDFFVFPKLADGHHLSLFWEGQRLDFDDATVVPFGERSVAAAATWVKAASIREIDRDQILSQAHMGNPQVPNTYIYLRKMCYLDGRDRRRFADSKSSPQPQSSCANTLICAQVPA